MSKYLLFFLVFILFSCGQQGENNQASHSDKDSVNSSLAAKDTLSEDYLIQAVFAVEEVMEKDKYIDSLTNHKQHVSVMIEKPDDEETDYHLRVGYNGDIRFETYYNFYINPITKKLTIEDVSSGDRLSMRAWCQRRSGNQ